ncbi:hypothetical protein DL96DRAFT_1610085 [Flagelloscypha sp. PMI_526]|nr:hypothetical protein DL96DRAFT_1610085 [Flagelloscypha sp. PMI_526]
MTAIDLAPELWAEVFAHCTKLDLARMCIVNSHFLEASRDALYYKLTITGTSALTTIALLDYDHIARRLRHLVADMRRLAQVFMSGPNGSSTIESLLDVLNSSGLLRLDMVELQYPHVSTFDSALFKFMRLPTLQYLKIVLPPFGGSENLVRLFQSKALRDLEVTEPALLSMVPRVAEPYPFLRPTLDTFSVRNGSVFWRTLGQYVDLGELRRLAIWDYEDLVRDLKSDWGDLVTLSASTLEVLSFWLTRNVLQRGISDYIRTVSGFPVLHTLSLLSQSSTLKTAAPGWASAYIPIIKAFHERSPSLQHIRVYVHGLPEVNLHEWLLPGVPTSKFAAEIRGLSGIRMVTMTFDTAPDIKSKEEVGDAIIQMFHPVRLDMVFNMRWNFAWPWFNDDLDDSYLIV